MHTRGRADRHSKKVATIKIKNSNTMVANTVKNHDHHKTNRNIHNSNKVNIPKINNIKTIRMKVMSRRIKLIIEFMITKSNKKKKRTQTSLQKRVSMRSLKRLHKKLTSSNNSMMLLLHNNTSTNHLQNNLRKKAHMKKRTRKSLTKISTNLTYQTIDIQMITLPPLQSSFPQALTRVCTMKRYKDLCMHIQMNNQSQTRIWAAKKATNSNLKAITNLNNIHKKSNTQMTIKTSKFMTIIIKLLKIINVKIIQMMMNNILINKERLLIESWHNKAQIF